MVQNFRASELASEATLSVAQCCNLKADDGERRVWLCRVGGGVTVETLADGRWVVTSGSCCAGVACRRWEGVTMIETCPVCSTPGHAGETDDFGRHPKCRHPLSETQMDTNKVAGTGYHSHEVPTVPNLALLMRDGQHAGTYVWRRSEEDCGANDHKFCFADLERRIVRTSERCLLIEGQDIDSIDGDDAYACDLDSPRGLILIGCDVDDDLSWVTEGADVLWDSNCPPR